MEQNEQLFPEENPPMEEAEMETDDSLDRQLRFQALIQGEFREEFEAAVAQRLQEALSRLPESPPAQETDGQPPAGPSAALRRHFQSLVRQGEELKAQFPDFDLMEEMQNPAFVRLTAPGSGISVKDAFYAVHGEEIQRESMQYAARQAGDRIAASVQAGASRPLENGMQALNPAPVALDVQNLDRQTREELRRRIRNGESIDFVHNM